MFSVLACCALFGMVSVARAAEADRLNAAGRGELKYVEQTSSHGAVWGFLALLPFPVNVDVGVLRFGHLLWLLCAYGTCALRGSGHV